MQILREKKKQFEHKLKMKAFMEVRVTAGLLCYTALV